MFSEVRTFWDGWGPDISISRAAQGVPTRAKAEKYRWAEASGSYTLVGLRIPWEHGKPRNLLSPFPRPLGHGEALLQRAWVSESLTHLPEDSAARRSSRTTGLHSRFPKPWA